MQDLVETVSLPLTGVALVCLWVLEGLLPAFEGWGESRGQRRRHLALGLLNGGVSGLLGLLVASAIVASETAGFGLLRWAAASDTLALHPVVAWVVAFLALDLAHYAFHVAAHKVPVVWRLHAVHHHAETMEATAALRFHTIEVALSCLSIVPVAVLMGLSLPQVLLYNAVLLPAALFHHADIDLSPRLDRWLRLVIVTPRMHWVHHSRWQPETDSNYAAVLSVWDRLFGTMRTRRRPETVDFGLDGFTADDTRTLRGWLATPFRERRATLGERPARRLLEPDDPAVSLRRPDDSASRAASAGRGAATIGR